MALRTGCSASGGGFGLVARMAGLSWGLSPERAAPARQAVPNYNKKGVKGNLYAFVEVVCKQFYLEGQSRPGSTVRTDDGVLA